MKAIQIAYDQNFEKKCEYASLGGFKYISVNLHETPDPSDITYDKAPENITKILKKYNLKAAQTHLYYYYPLHSADKIDDALEHRVLREIEVSGKIGAKWCVWHPRYYVSGEWETGEYDEEKTLYYNHIFRVTKRFYAYRQEMYSSLFASLSADNSIVYHFLQKGNLPFSYTCLLSNSTPSTEGRRQLYCQ